MPKFCRDCGRPKDKAHLCDMATLTDGRVVHVSRIDVGGDLHDKIGPELQVKNRWIKKNQLKKKARRS